MLGTLMIVGIVVAIGCSGNNTEPLLNGEVNAWTARDMVDVLLATEHIHVQGRPLFALSSQRLPGHSFTA